jgi:hypothetical protein
MGEKFTYHFGKPNITISMITQYWPVAVSKSLRLKSHWEYMICQYASVSLGNKRHRTLHFVNESEKARFHAILRYPLMRSDAIWVAEDAVLFPLDSNMILSTLSSIGLASSARLPISEREACVLWKENWMNRMVWRWRLTRHLAVQNTAAVMRACGPGADNWARRITVLLWMEAYARVPWLER